MHRRIDLWFGRMWLRSCYPEIEPGFGGSEFEDPDALHVRERALAREHLLQSGGIDDPVPGEMPAQQPIADFAPEVIEDASSKMARASLDPPAGDKKSVGRARTHGARLPGPVRRRAIPSSGSEGRLRGSAATSGG